MSVLSFFKAGLAIPLKDYTEKMFKSTRMKSFWAFSFAYAILGNNIENLLQPVFNEAQEAFYKKLASKTLEQLIKELYIIGEK